MTMGSRNYTRELRRAKEQGAKIVCSMEPYRGLKVEYAPRHKGDPQPWRLTVPIKPEYPGNGDDPVTETTYRYSGRECHPVGQGGGPWALARLLVIPVA